MRDRKGTKLILLFSESKALNLQFPHVLYLISACGISITLNYLFNCSNFMNNAYSKTNQ